MKSGVLFLLIKTLKLELRVSNDGMGVTFRILSLGSRDLFTFTLKRTTVAAIYDFLDKLRPQLGIDSLTNKRK